MSPKEEKTKEKVQLQDDIFNPNLGNLPSLIDEANKSLNTTNPKPFSEQAYNTLKQRISTFILELVNESVKNAKRDKADYVSASHVNKASKYLVSLVRSKSRQIIGTVGGIFLGATMSNILSMVVNSTTPTVLGVAGIALLGIIGAFMVAWNLLND